MTNTYDRRTQRLAAERRYEDALALQRAGRWNGAIYLGGYAIECSLKSLICYTESKIVLTETKLFKPKEGQETDPHNRVNLHNLDDLLTYASTEVNLMIRADKSRKFNEARKTVVNLWKMSELRYEAKVTHKNECERFMADVELLYSFIMRRLDVYRSTYHD